MQDEGKIEALLRGVILWDQSPPRAGKNHGLQVMVRCECGKVRAVNLDEIRRRGASGLCQSCQRTDSVKSRPARPTQVGRCVVLWDEPFERHGSQRQYHVRVRCECGEKRLIHPGDLRHPRFTGLCRTCRAREHYATLNTKKGPENRNFKGFKRIDKRGGYVHIAVFPDDEFYGMAPRRVGLGCRYVLEHRLVMARHLGRPLESWEQVHHKDRDKTNNALENLEILDGATHSSVTAMQAEIGRLKDELHRLRGALGVPHPPPE